MQAIASAFFFFGLFWFLASSQVLGQDVEIRIDDPNDQKINLGLIEWTPRRAQDPPLPIEIGKILAADLEFSGRAKIVEALAWGPSTRELFLSKEIYAFVQGEYIYDGQQARVKSILRDTETGDTILVRNYEADKRRLRQLAHAFADDIVQQLFGEKGVAQTKIVYITRQGNHKQVALIDYDGANVQLVTQGSYMHLFPCWLRDNQSLMYTSYKGNRPQLYTYNISNRSEQLFIESKFLNTGCHFNPIDGEITYTSSVKGNTEIFRVHESGSQNERLTFSRGLESDASWSPQGYEIVFTSNRSGAPQLYIMDRDGSNIRRLTYEGGYNASPSWSPRGDKIAFCSMNERRQMDIFTISPNGTQLRRLTQSSGSNESPSFSPDGRSLVFVSDRAGRKTLYRMREDGSKQEVLLPKGENVSPEWSHFSP